MNKLREHLSDCSWDQGETTNIYDFPLPQNSAQSKEIKKLTIGIPLDQLYYIGPFIVAKSPESHIGPFAWAIDFLVPDGTDILAAKDGKIIDAVDNFDKWGPTEDFKDMLNHVTISHENGEHSQYCHLARHSFRETGLNIGSLIKKGQLIGKVGKTGWTDRDHLHFFVFRVGKLHGNPYDFYGLKIRFDQK